jgi:hypothetical protein
LECWIRIPNSNFPIPNFATRLKVWHRFARIRTRAKTRGKRFDFDAYNIFNSNWPFTVANTFSTLPSSQWLRPTNVLAGAVLQDRRAVRFLTSNAEFADSQEEGLRAPRPFLFQVN